MTPYEQSVTILARLAILAAFALLIGSWLLGLVLRCFYSWRAWRRKNRRRGYVNVFWPRGSERWFR